MIRRRLWLVLAVCVLADRARAEGAADEHAAHHPGPSMAAPPWAGPSSAGPPAGAPSEGMEMGMHLPPPLPLIPSLMSLHKLDPESRAKIQAAARERMATGTALMGEALDELARAAPGNDHAAMQASLAKLREGIARFDSGLAANRALEAGSSPRAIATQWLRSRLSLPGPPLPVRTAGWWGLSWEHAVGMALLVAFASVMIAMYFVKMRRATQLLQDLATARPGAWGGSLRVARIFSETPSIKTFRLVDPRGGTIPFSFLAGQFLTLALPVEGRSVKRSYTIASSPAQRDYVELTIKREDKGLASRHMCDEVREGALISVAGPQGAFTFAGTEAEGIVLIGGGVGVTPLMSIVRYLTDRGWGRPIDLVLTFRRPEEYLFREELDYLQRRHSNLRVVATMSSAGGAAWAGATGRLTKELLARNVPDIARRRVHLCGPAAMMDAVKAMLAELGVRSENIKIEAFGPAEKPRDRQAVVTAAMADVMARDSKSPQVAFTISGKTAPLPPDTTVLEAAEHVGVAIDASCRAGTCGTCKVRLVEGSVTMAVEDALTAEDKARKIILACQARASADVSVEA